MHSLIPVGTYIMWNEYTVTPLLNRNILVSLAC
jgi:hypothetical protein